MRITREIVFYGASLFRMDKKCLILPTAPAAIKFYCNLAYDKTAMPVNLKSQESNRDPLAVNATGLLLHPSVGDMVNEAVVIQNHEIRFATVDLGAAAKEIRAQLLQVVD